MYARNHNLLPLPSGRQPTPDKTATLGFQTSKEPTAQLRQTRSGQSTAPSLRMALLMWALKMHGAPLSGTPVGLALAVTVGQVLGRVHGPAPTQLRKPVGHELLHGEQLLGVPWEYAIHHSRTAASRAGEQDFEPCPSLEKIGLQC